MTESKSSKLDENQLFEKVCDDLQKIHDIKSSTYGDSWKRRGELISVFGNVARKFDRIEKMATNLEIWNKAIKGQLNESIEDTVLDLAVYSILWCTYLLENRPELYKKAIENATGLK